VYWTHGFLSRLPVTRVELPPKEIVSVAAEYFDRFCAGRQDGRPIRNLVAANWRSTCQLA